MRISFNVNGKWLQSYSSFFQSTLQGFFCHSFPQSHTHTLIHRWQWATTQGFSVLPKDTPEPQPPHVTLLRQSLATQLVWKWARLERQERVGRQERKNKWDKTYLFLLIFSILCSKIEQKNNQKTLDAHRFFADRHIAFVAHLISPYSTAYLLFNIQSNSCRLVYSDMQILHLKQFSA